MLEPVTCSDKACQLTIALNATRNGLLMLWMLQALQDMLSASQQDLEAFLTQVYRAIAGAAPLKDKVSPAVSPHTSYTKHAQSDASGIAC